MRERGQDRRGDRPIENFLLDPRRRIDEDLFLFVDNVDSNSNSRYRRRRRRRQDNFFSLSLSLFLVRLVSPLWDICERVRGGRR